MVFAQQHVFGFDAVGVQGDAGDRANLNALGLVEVTHALGAAVGVDLINFFTHEYRLVGTFGFTNIAVDALLGDHQGHERIIAAPAPP
jgi:hypothetical protein